MRCRTAPVGLALARRMDLVAFLQKLSVAAPAAVAEQILGFFDTSNQVSAAAPHVSTVSAAGHKSALI